MKHSPKPPKAFAALVIGMLGFTLASTYVFVSAAPPSKVAQQKVQPEIAKLYIKALNTEGKTVMNSFDWAGAQVKPLIAKAPQQKSMEFFATTKNDGSKVPIWYAFDSFWIGKSMSQSSIEKIIAANAPKDNSKTWTKTRRSVVVNTKLLDEDNTLVVAAYVKNNDPTGASGVGSIDSIAYIVVRPDALVVEQPAELSVVTSVATPVAHQYVMGAVDQPIAEFKMTAGATEDVLISELTVAMHFDSSAKFLPMGAVKNVRLYDGDVVIGSAVAALATVGTVEPGTGYATFNNLKLNIGKGKSKMVTVAADFASAPEELSGTIVTAYIAEGVVKNGGSAIIAKGVESGTSAKISGLQTGWAKNTPMSNAATLYLTKITVAHAATAPSGSATKGSSQVVARFVISNSANVNNQAAIIDSFVPSIWSSIAVPAGKVSVAKVYAGENLNSAGVFMWGGYEGPLFSLAADSPYEKPVVNKQVIIESGSSQVFTVTLDTTNATSNDVVTASIQQGGIIWSDGFSDGISTVDALPLVGKTLMY